MILALRNLIAKTPGGDLMFFQTAYLFIFKKDGNVIPDLLAYRERGHIPLYVQSYVKYIEELDNEGAHGF